MGKFYILDTAPDAPSPFQFFDTEFAPVGGVPEGAKAISDEDHAALFARQAEGKRIVADQNGDPIVADPPGPTTDQLWAALRGRRNGLLDETQKLVDRHRDQVTLGGATNLNDAKFSQLLTYRQALRDLPQTTRNPSVPVWPAPPA